MPSDPHPQAQASELLDALREAAGMLKPMAEVASDIPDDWGHGHQCVTACGHFRDVRTAYARLTKILGEHDGHDAG